MTAERGGDALRLFVAVELPDDVRRALDDAVATLKRAGIDEGLRWVRPEGIHVTLKFLGATPREKVDAITAGLRDAVSGVAPFELRPEGLGTFHGGRNQHFTRQYPREHYPSNIRVLWVGMGGDTAQLAELAARVELAIAPLGFPTEKRPFAAHLTLARVRDEADKATRERLSSALSPFVSKSGYVVGVFDESRVPKFPAFRADSLSLMQSTLQPGGAVYRALATLPLRASS